MAPDLRHSTIRSSYTLPGSNCCLYLFAGGIKDLRATNPPCMHSRVSQVYGWIGTCSRCLNHHATCGWKLRIWRVWCDGRVHQGHGPISNLSTWCCWSTSLQRTSLLDLSFGDKSSFFNDEFGLRKTAAKVSHPTSVICQLLPRFNFRKSPLLAKAFVRDCIKSSSNPLWLRFRISNEQDGLSSIW